MLHELRYAVRTLVKSPGFTLVAILSLALGIGANSAIFSLADGLLLRPLPVATPNEVVNVVGRGVGRARTEISYRDFVDFRDNAKAFQGLVAHNDLMVGLAEQPDALPKMQIGLVVSGNFFDVMGVRPALGRGFRPEEDQVPNRDHVALLGYDAWQTQFGGDPNVLGRTIRLNGVEFTIIGVAPQEFSSLDQFTRDAFFVPTMMAEALGMGTENRVWEKRDFRSFRVKGRLKPGVSLAQAEAELTAIAKGLEQQYQDTNRNQSISVQTELQSRMERDPIDAALVWTLMGLVGLVLLIACSNVANLMLSRGRERAHEIAIRLAIGCGRGRLIRQLFTESLLIALAGGAVGLIIAYAGVEFFSGIKIPTDLPISVTVRLDQRVLWFTLAASVVSAVAFGLVPALQTTRTAVTPDLRSARTGADRRRMWGRNGLVAIQVSISLVLMVAALTLYRGFRDLILESPGFRTDHLLMVSVDPSLNRYSPDQTREFYKQLVERARNTAGVKSAALGRAIPFAPNQQLTRDLVPEGYQFPEGKETAPVFGNVVGEGFVETMRIPVVRGRSFNATDTADSPKVAMVNEKFAEKFWPGSDPIGKRFRVGGKNADWVQVVGVTKTGKYLWIGEAPTEFFYLPLTQTPQNRLVLVAESFGDPAALAQPIREVLRGLDPNLPVFDIRTMEALFNMRAVATPNIVVETVGVMGVMGLLLSMCGLYALIAYSVSRRTREIGIRMAVGADRTSVLRMVLRQGLLLGGAGVAFGLILSLASSQVLLSAFNAQGVDPVAYIAVITALVVVTALAAIVPALRASKVDPIRALRYE